MPEYNKLLQRQIRRNLKNLPELPEEFKPIFQSVSESYDHYESDRNMLERSLELSSQELNQAKSKIQHALNEIEEKNKDIMDSINYALRIQQAILPKEEHFLKAFNNAFVLFKPKDIVSGDFYWLSEFDNKIFFTAADCTGHGVPGAFMSMIGTALFNEVVNEKGIYEPNDILNAVRKGVITSLKQKGQTGEQKDGMDASLCLYDKERKRLTYSGANNPLYLIRKNAVPLFDEQTEIKKPVPPVISGNGLEFYEIKADKQPIGLHHGEMMSFTNHVFQLEDGDAIYTFSDGYADQFGGEHGKKFKYLTFKNLLLSIQDKSMQEQKKVLDVTIENWRNQGHCEQVDDICVLGVKIG